jgi:flagellar basal-body rod modification protein FlgD
MISATSSSTAIASSSSASSVGASDMAASQDRFLKLLVAQLNNQDPMNPVDNAQMTSQMAQINTVTGIQQVNDTLKSLSDQFASLQMVQGSAMVGHQVLVESNTLSRQDGIARGALDLNSPADSVKVEILSAGGQVIDTLDLGARAAGRHNFDWNAAGYQGSGEPGFRVVATQGKTVVGSTAFAQDKVLSVGTSNGSLTVQLQGREPLAYNSIKAIL